MNKRPASSILSSALMALVLFVCGCLYSQPASAQSARIVHDVVKSHKPSQSMGRDLWFSMAKNYELGEGKFYELYVASPSRATVHIAIGKATDQKFQIGAEEVLVFRLPLAWEMTQSNVIEDKAVHVYSENADLTAYLLSRNPYTSDGMYIIPSIGWGTEYVLASFASYAYYAQYDYPSEFVIVANQDNTNVTITPNADIREGMDRNLVAHVKNKPFTVTLNKGQAAQYMCVYANGDMENFNLSGSVITSDKPIGVVSGVQCTNIPAENTACDHICDMLPPTRTWATTYYTGPFVKRVGGDAFLVVAKEDNTTVYRTSASGTRTHCVLNKFGTYMRHDIDEASKWYSDKPFMLVQYCNSTDYPDPGSNAGIGDPNMTVVNAVEQFSPFVLFQTPKISPGSSQFTNYVNVIVHKNAVNSTKLDGGGIAGKLGALPIPGTDYLVYRGSNLKPGSHTIISDSGVGVYIYGYGVYESYAWTGAFGTRTFNSPDTIPPTVATPTECYCARIELKDIHLDASKLATIDLDTNSNFTFEIDPAWQAGVGIDKAFYDICVVDPTKEAFIRVAIFDAAGNTTTVTSRYTPQIASIAPALTDFGVGDMANASYKYITITIDGKTDFNLTTLKLQVGNQGFAIDSPTVNPPLKPGEVRRIKISFKPVVPETVADTVLFGDECLQLQAIVIGNGGAPDFSVFGTTIGPIVVGTKHASNSGNISLVKPVEGVYIQNSSNTDITITKLDVVNTAEFELDPTATENMYPFVVPKNSKRDIVVNYKPTVLPGAVTDVVFTSSNAGTKIAKVFGKSIEPGAEIVKDVRDTLSCVTPGQTKAFTFKINPTGSATTTIKGLRLSGDILKFSTPKVTDVGGADVTFPAKLPLNQGWDVATTFTADPGINGTYSMTIEMLDENDQVFKDGTVTATATTEYRAYRYNNVPVFPAVPYNSAPIQRDMEIENLTALPITVQTPVPDMMNPGSHPGSFSIVAPATWPITLGPNEKRTITIQFDPSKSVDQVQTMNLLASTTACANSSALIQGGISVGGITAGSYPAQEVFSCTSTTLDIPVTGDMDIAPKPLTWTISGADGARWTTAIPDGMDIGPNQTIDVPVVFTPIPGTLSRTYSAQIDFSYTNSQGITKKVTVPLTGVSGGIVASATSTFANRDAEAGDVVRLPITIDIAKNVQTLDLSTANLQQVHLVYTYNTDLLSFGTQNIANSVKNPPPGWSVDGARSKETATGLDLWMTGTRSLTEADKSLGEIEFFVRLPEKDQTDDVKLESFELLGANGETFGQCLSTSATGTQLNLVYRCGDAVYREIMENGKLASIQPLTPNPITDQKIVTFRYATRVETPITLEIIDAMGNVVDRVVNDLFHQVGAYEVNYDVSKLTTGSYIYRLTAYGTKSSNRFVVTK